MATKRICSVDGCGKPHSAKGYCGMHYTKWKRLGDPLAGKTHASYGSIGAFLREIVPSHDSDDCLIWPFQRTKKGYPVVSINGARTTASRYICEQHHGAPPTNEHQAAHSCGNGHRGCVNKSHLRWATVSENHLDKREHGTCVVGEASNFAKLTEADVRQIRKLRPTTRASELARKFGCSTGTIWMICSGRAWRHI